MMFTRKGTKIDINITQSVFLCNSGVEPEWACLSHNQVPWYVWILANVVRSDSNIVRSGLLNY